MHANSTQKRAPQVYLPPGRKTPLGVVNKLPVLASQEMFRSNVMVATAEEMSHPGRSAMSPTLTSSAAMSSPIPRADSPNTSLKRNPLLLTSLPKFAAQVDGNKALEKLEKEIDTFIQNELGMLATHNDGTMEDAGPQRLAVFKSAFRMLLPALPHSLQRHMEGIMSEYDRFLQSLERSVQDNTRMRERQRLEAHYAQHFTEEARMKEAELEKKKRDFEAQQNSMKAKLVNLEKQLVVFQNENRSLKAQQNEDTERYSSMAQAVIESRLAANKAELALIDMKEVYEKVRMVEKNSTDIIQDYGKMLKLIRFNKLNFEPKSTTMVDALLREGIL